MRQTDDLRKIITDGFKEYDGDIKLDALEALDELENELLRIKMISADKTNKIKELQANIYYHTIDEDVNVIDFGIGSIYYLIGDNSNLPEKELMEALQNVAMIVPLPRVINAIKGLTRL